MSAAAGQYLLNAYSREQVSKAVVALLDDARRLRESCTVFGSCEWDDIDDKIRYQELCRLARELNNIANHRVDDEERVL